ncbi:MAG: hypothetical protein HY675_11455 [Chloroflexi bacterium]|nr:hypothetical protein [Chloroflexota bacterium]
MSSSPGAEPPTADPGAAGWAEQDSAADTDANQNADDGGEWLVIGIVVVIAAAILFVVLIGLQLGTGHVHVH